MGKFERKIRRKQAKQKMKEAEKDMTQKVALFGNLSDECLICQEPFDKANKEMVKSWYVVVREQEEKVNLYCPPCWELAMQRVKEIQKMMEASNDN